MNNYLIKTFFVFTLVLLNGLNCSFAQGYPNRPVRIISPIPPGSGTESAIRAIAQQMQIRTGQPWYIESKPGANYILAAEACAKAVPDGYTFCFFSGTVTSFNPYTFKKLPYDAERDFKPITRLFFLVNGLIGSGNLQSASIKDLQALAISKGESLNFGTLGPGSSPDIFRQWLNTNWKTNIVAIPYNGGPAIVRAIMAGDIHLSSIGMGSVSGQLNSNRMKVLAIEGASRSPSLPDVPTFAESGFDAYPIKAWWGLLAPAGVPDSIIQKVSAEIKDIYANQKFMDTNFQQQFLQPAFLSGDEFGGFMKTDRELATQLFKKLNLQQE